MLNGKKVPVPIPLLNVDEALEWVSSHLVSEEQIITKINLNGIPLEELKSNLPVSGPKDPFSLDLVVESPVELAQKIFDVLPNLLTLILSSLRPLAVELWQIKDKKVIPRKILQLINDIKLLCELSDSSIGFSVNRVLTDPVVYEVNKLKSYKDEIEKSVKKFEYKNLASILLNKVEPVVQNLSELYRELQEEANSCEK